MMTNVVNKMQSHHHKQPSNVTLAEEEGEIIQIQMFNPPPQPKPQMYGSTKGQTDEWDDESDSDDEIMADIQIDATRQPKISPKLAQVQSYSGSGARHSNVYRRGTKTEWTKQQVIEYQSELTNEVQRKMQELMNQNVNVPVTMGGQMNNPSSTYSDSDSDEDVLSQVNQMSPTDTGLERGVSDMFSTPVPNGHTTMGPSAE